MPIFIVQTDFSGRIKLKTRFLLTLLLFILSATVLVAQDAVVSSVADTTFSAGSVYKENAIASFYAEKFHGCITANGETFDMNAFTAAHKTLPFNTLLKVTNLANNKSVTVRINDRGPFIEGREIDLSKAAAIAIDMVDTGTANVQIEIVSIPEETKTETANTETANTETAKSETITVTETPYTGPLWRIQIGAYAAQANAYNLVKKLRDAGFSPAYEKNGNIIRVVLPGIKDSERIEVETSLKKAGFTDYFVRKER